MAKPSFQVIQKLVHELILPFYQLERDLSLPLKNHRNETDAEHSWSLALMALALGPRIDPSLDVNKACGFAVIHDLVEVYAGDTSVWAADSEHATKHVREIKALATIKNRFAQFPSLADMIESYEQKDSPEALFVYALDKFLALLMLYEDHGYYYHRDKITKQRFDKQFEPHRQKARSHKAVSDYYEQLRAEFDAHPEYFYQP